MNGREEPFGRYTKTGDAANLASEIGSGAVLLRLKVVLPYPLVFIGSSIERPSREAPRRFHPLGLAASPDTKDTQKDTKMHHSSLRFVSFREIFVSRAKRLNSLFPQHALADKAHRLLAIRLKFDRRGSTVGIIRRRLKLKCYFLLN